MARIGIYGGSDDAVYVTGDMQEQFDFAPNKPIESRILAVSDGTLLRVNYDEDGIWRLTRITAGTAEYQKVEGDVEKDTNDVVYLSGEDVTWVAFATKYAWG